MEASTAQEGGIVRDRLKGWSKAEGEPQARATEKERQPGVQSYEPTCLRATHRRMTNQRLKKQRLIAIKKLWVNIHNYRRNPVGFVKRPVRLSIWRGPACRGVVVAEGENPQPPD